MRYFRLDISIFVIYHAYEIANRDIPCAADRKSREAAHAGGGIRLNAGNDTYTELAWAAFALAEYVPCPLSEAFEVLLLPSAVGMYADAVANARARLTWRTLLRARQIVSLLRGFFLEDDREGFTLLLTLWQDTAPRT